MRQRRISAPAIRIFAALLGALLMSGCGFQLRGTLQLDNALSPLAITGLPQGNELVVDLRRRVAAQNLQLTEDLTAAHTVIILADEHIDRVVTAVGPDGRAREYRALYTLNFRATRDNGTRLETQKLSLYRDFAFAPGQVLAAGNEEALLQKEMQHEAAYTILRALEALGGRAAATRETAP